MSCDSVEGAQEVMDIIMKQAELSSEFKVKLCVCVRVRVCVRVCVCVCM